MAFNPGSGWERINREMAVKVETGAEKAKAAGRISDAQYAKMIADAKKLHAKADSYIGRTAWQTISKGFPKVGKVAVSTVAGLITGGPVGAAAGFVAGAKSFGGSGGIIPTGIDVATPPIVKPEPKPAQTVTGSDRSGEPLLILLAWVAMLWVLFKRRRK